MLFGPVSSAGGEDVAMVPEGAADPVHGGGAVALVAGPQPQEPAERFDVLGGDVDRREMAATVEFGEHDGVEAVGLAAVAGPAGNERRGDDVAVKAVPGEDPLEDEAGTGGLVAGPYRSLLGKPAHESADLHQVGGKGHHLGALGIAREDGGRDLLGVDIETNGNGGTHGWAPF